MAPAKLNLYLDVLGRRTDGFHELETLLAPIRLYDRLVWSPCGADGSTDLALAYDPSSPSRLTAALPADERNLVWRAVALLAQTAGMEPHGSFTLAKRIPIQAGLGGGSSNAAAALVLANKAWGINYPTARLGELAAQLGSDIPFFLAGQSAVCRGRGERVEAVAGLPRLNVVVCAPAAGVSTIECFRQLNAPAWGDAANRPSSGRLVELIGRLQRGTIAAALVSIRNSLQLPALQLCPAIERVAAAFAALGCYAHQLTGSGSAYFGVMRSGRQARLAAARLAAANLGTVFATATCR